MSLTDGRLFVFDGVQAAPWAGQQQLNFRGRLSTLRTLADGNVALAASGEGLFILSPEGALLLSLTTPQFLRAQPLILYEDAGNTRRIIDKWFARASEPAKPVMALGSVEAIKRLVAARLGCSVLPALATEAEVAAGTLAAMPLSPALDRRLGLVIRHDKRLTRGLRELIAGLPSD